MKLNQDQLEQVRSKLYRTKVRGNVLEDLVRQVAKEADGYELPNPWVKFGRQKGMKDRFISWTMDQYSEALAIRWGILLEDKEEKPSPVPTPPPSPIPSPAPKPEPVPTSNKEGGDLLGDLVDAVAEEVLKKSIKRDQIEAIVNETVKKAIAGQPTEKIIVNPATGTEKKIKTASKYLKEVLSLATIPNVNVCMTGPAGCGKTYLAKQVAEALDYKFVSLSLTAGVSEGHLTGWLLPVGDSGKFVHIDSPILKAWMEGNSVILLDEMDAADPNTLLVANQMLANGFMYLAQRHLDPEALRGKNCIILAAMNTMGNGADMIYSGREKQDGAALDRFELVEMDYDSTLESKLVPNDLLIEWATKIRKNIKKYKLQRMLSTRRLIRYYNMLANNKTLSYCENKFFIGWSADEKKKALNTEGE